MTKDIELSRLIVEYIGYGRYAIPSRTWANVDLSSTEGETKSTEVLRILEQLDNVQVDWDDKTLVEGAHEARRDMAAHHEELTDEALDALEWAFAYEWK
jgi:hypothetical protein